jgi:uncharacterized surface protein with fasciclin (FAS1) repeats
MKSIKPTILFFCLSILSLALFSACGSNNSNPNKNRNIMQVVHKRGDLSSLSSYLEQTDLNSTLEGKGPYTLFAPSDAAFNNISDSVRQTWTTDQLTAILKYHILSQPLTTSDINSPETVTTLNGAELTITKKNDKIMLTGQQGKTYQVKKANIKASNGIIYIINGVLMPE